MHTKLMVILANSRRKGGRCIAAKEVELGCGGVASGDWIRPVAPSGQSTEGELHQEHSTLSGGHPIQVLDVVRARFDGPDKDPRQPENWRLAQRPGWEVVDRYPAECLEQLVDHPTGLWDHPQSRDNFRRIAVDAPLSAFAGFSLALIRPRNFSIGIFRGINPWRDKVTQENTGRFEYGGQKYACRITDDAFEAQYCRLAQGGSREFASPFGDDCLLCMSLSAPFNGHHYKLIAAIIPLCQPSTHLEIAEADVPF